ATQYVRRLGELDVVVADDFYAVAPWVEKVQELPGQRFDARVVQCVSDRFLVIHDQAEMTAVVSRLLTALLQGKELVAPIDERRRGALATQFEIEQAAIESQSFFDIADFEGDVVETDGTCFFSFGHGRTPFHAQIRAIAAPFKDVTGTHVCQEQLSIKLRKA